MRDDKPITVMNKWISYILLLLFCAMPFIEALHRHQDSLRPSKPSGYSKSGKYLSATQGKCALCDYNVHKAPSSSLPLLETGTAPVIVTVKLRRIPIPVFLAAGFVHLSGNKGPPISC